MLNPTDNVAVAIPVEGVYDIEPIPTPAPLSVGMMVGVTLLIPFVFWRISTSDTPGVTLKSTSGTTFPVTPSITTNLGATMNPLPKDTIPIESNEARDSIFITCGKRTVGSKVLSDGYLNPISLIDTDFTDPMPTPKVSNSAPFPDAVVTVVTPGRE